MEKRKNLSEMEILVFFFVIDSPVFSVQIKEDSWMFFSTPIHQADDFAQWSSSKDNNNVLFIIFPLSECFCLHIFHAKKKEKRRKVFCFAFGWNFVSEWKGRDARSVCGGTRIDRWNKIKQLEMLKRPLGPSWANLT